MLLIEHFAKGFDLTSQSVAGQKWPAVGAASSSSSSSPSSPSSQICRGGLGELRVIHDSRGAAPLFPHR